MTVTGALMIASSVEVWPTAKTWKVEFTNAAGGVHVIGNQNRRVGPTPTVATRLVQPIYTRSPAAAPLPNWLLVVTW